MSVSAAWMIGHVEKIGILSIRRASGVDAFHTERQLLNLNPDWAEAQPEINMTGKQIMLFDEFEREIFDIGQQIFKSGDAGDCAYLIEEGVVEILVPKQGEEHRIRLMGKGELFGEVSLIDYQPRTATVKAVERTVLVPIPRIMMERLLERCDPVLRHLLLVILERFRQRNDDSVMPDAKALYEPEQQKRRSMVRKEATKKLSLAHGMKRALGHGEFQLYYQPICNLSDGRIAGFEALIRWHDPIDGLIQPNDFLWIAEQTGLINEIGVWTLKRACRDWQTLRRFTDYKTPFVSVNLSASQLNNEMLVDDVKDAMKDQNVDSTELRLELTETAMVEQPEAASKIMHRLIELGLPARHAEDRRCFRRADTDQYSKSRDCPLYGNFGTFAGFDCGSRRGRI